MKIEIEVEIVGWNSTMHQPDVRFQLTHNGVSTTVSAIREAAEFMDRYDPGYKTSWEAVLRTLASQKRIEFMREAAWQKLREAQST